MKHEVFWKNPGYLPYLELKEDIVCDYLVVGGGIAGVSAAYHIAKMGGNVVLAEKHAIGSGATGMAAGTLVTRAERNLQDLVEEFGEERAREIWNSTKEVLREMKKLIDTEGIDCEEEIQDTLICGFKGKNYTNIPLEFEVEKRFEEGSEYFEGEAVKSEINSPLFSHAMLSASHGLCLNPLKFIQGFSHAAEKYGARIYENTAVLKASNGHAQTQYGNIKYRKILWAIDVDYPNADIKNLKTTIIVTRPLTHEEVKTIGFSHRKKVVWDTRKNEIYFKLTHDNRLLMGFGGIIVHKKHRKTDPHFPHLNQLIKEVKRLFPYLNLEIEYAWSGHFGVNKHWSIGPLVEFKGEESLISGAASQVICFMAAKHLAYKMMGKNSPLEHYFKS
jgi:glycine/D-amino acid oxidase-like deaminating enzyme